MFVGPYPRTEEDLEALLRRSREITHPCFPTLTQAV
jgi:hypothetical protein